MTKERVLTFVLTGSLALGTGMAFAQTAQDELAAGKRWLQMMNHKGDTDDTISREEFNRYMDKQFRAADTDHDGTLDAAELGHLHTMLLGK